MKTVTVLYHPDTPRSRTKSSLAYLLQRRPPFSCQEASLFPRFSDTCEPRRQVTTVVFSGPPCASGTQKTVFPRIPPPSGPDRGPGEGLWHRGPSSLGSLQHLANSSPDPLSGPNVVGSHESIANLSNYKMLHLFYGLRIGQMRRGRAVSPGPQPGQFL